MEGLEQSLSKIRKHTNSQLENQKRPALLLEALESTISEQANQRSPTTYFAALLSTGDQITTQNDPNNRLLAATLYLLALVMPHCPDAVLRTKMDAILALVSPALSNFSNDAAVIKSVLGILQPLYLTLTSNQFRLLSITQTYNSVLQLIVDPRPKVRKRAQELVQDVLKRPTPPMTTHPFTPRTSQWILFELGAVINENKKRNKKKDGDDLLATKAMSICGVVRSLASHWSDETLASLLPLIVKLPRVSSTFLASQSYTLLQALFSSSPDSFTPQSVLSTINALLEAKPDRRDQLTLPGWLSGLESGIVSLARKHPDQAEIIVKEQYEDAMNLLTSEASSIRVAAEDILKAMIRYGISDAGVSNDGSLGQIYASVLNSLQSLEFRSSGATPHLLSVASSIVSRARIRVDDNPVALSLCSELAQLVDGLRTEKSFEYRDKADEVIGTLIEVCGPEHLLKILPLNIHESLKGETGRAWLLPILAKRTTNTALNHFVTFFIPLSDHFFSRHEVSSTAGKGHEIEVKVYETLIEQIWATFPGYCDLPVDLPKAFTQSLMEHLATLLYQRPSLRPSILRGLQLLVERNRTLAMSSATNEMMKMNFGIDQTDGQKNLDLIKAQTSNILLVLFNVFSSVGREKGGSVLDCVSTYLSILDAEEINSTYEKVHQFLTDALPAAEANMSTQSPEEQTRHKAAHSMMDLIVTLIPFVDTTTSEHIFEMATDSKLITSKDPVLQKKTYRALTRLCTESVSGKALITEKITTVIKALSETQKSVLTAAKRDRITLLAAVAPILPSTELHLIPSLIPEAVLATKEANEKTREAAYELVISLGGKMRTGGTVKLRMLEGMAEDEEMSEDKAASLEEYFSMVSAGLEDPSPHMVSATITALSRMLFEFHESLSASTINDLIVAMNDFLGNLNREIAKSAIGAIKVAIVSLPKSAVMPHLSDIVPGLLKWSNEHKNQFKVKIRHLFERLIRKFGFEEIDVLVSDEHKKLINNVRKRQLRAKRQKSSKADASDDESEEKDAPKRSGQNAYEEVLYGSESEFESSGDEDEDDPKKRGERERKKGSSRRPLDARKGGKGDRGRRIEEDDDEAMDLLDPKMMGKISGMEKKATNEKRRERNGDRFQTDKSGRMYIKEDDDDKGKLGKAKKRGREDIDDGGDSMMDIHESTNAYLEAIRGEDGFRRDGRGKMKANKAGKGDMEENEMMMGGDDGMVMDNKRNKRKKTSQPAAKLGSEFKAKRAGGDVKKGGVSPYAYLPLNSMVKQRAGTKGRGRIDIVGKGMTK